MIEQLSLELRVDKGCRRLNWFVEHCPCDIFIEENNTRLLNHHIVWYIYKTRKSSYSVVYILDS